MKEEMNFESPLPPASSNSKNHASDQPESARPCAAVCNVNRRSFLQLLAGGMGVAMLSGCGGSDEAGVSKKPRAVAVGAEWKISDAAELQPGEALAFDFPDDTPGLVFLDSKNQLGAVSSVCPHAGCIVRWQGSDAEFRCPCHGSRFDIKGRVLTGPSEQSLTLFAARREEKDILITATTTKPEKPSRS